MTIVFIGSNNPFVLIFVQCWSSGRLQHVPMLFVPNLNSKSNVAGGPVVLNPDLEQSLRGGDGEEEPLLDLHQPTVQLFSPRTKDG